MQALAINKRAHFDYEILEKYEAGLVLKGFEVKSIKTGHISLKGAFVTIKGSELYLTNANIPLYKFAGKVANYDPTASRKLLVHKKEIKYLVGRRTVRNLVRQQQRQKREQKQKRLRSLPFQRCLHLTISASFICLLRQLADSADALRHKIAVA